LNRRQTTSQVAPLAASQASSDIQDGGADVQDDVLFNASVLEWPDPDSCYSSSYAVIRRPAAERPKDDERRSFSVAAPHTWRYTNAVIIIIIILVKIPGIIIIIIIFNF